MPTKVLCPWIMCNHNSKHKQVGEVGECQHKGEIELMSPDENLPKHSYHEPIPAEVDIEVDDLLVCMQFEHHEH